MCASRNVRRRSIGWTAAATLIAAIAAGGAVVAVQAQQDLILVSTDWAPFTNVPGKPRFALDLVEAALRRIGMTATTRIVSAADFTPALLGGEYDGSAAAWKDPGRERVLLYSQPYLENRLVLVGRRGADVSATTLADLKGKRIAIVEGYSYGDGVDTPGPVFVRSRSEEDSFAQMLDGKVDYTLMDELVVEYLVSNYPKESAARLQIGSTPLVRRELYLAIRRTRPDADSIISRFNAELRGMIADRTYHRLLHVQWIRADINGDGVSEYVPANEQPGPSEPKRIYTLFSAPDLTPEKPVKPGFYFGGNIYTDWKAVPDSYKGSATPHPDASRSTASLFTFRW